MILLILGLTLMGIVGAGYPQAFALAAAVLADDDRRQRATSVLRSGWSLAWAIGPMVGAGLLVVYGYAGLFRASAIALLLTAAVAVIVPPPRRITQDSDGAEGTGSGAAALSRWVIIPITAGMVLVHCAMFAGSIALPLLVTQDLRGPRLT